MDVMTDPNLWSGQDRMLTVEDMENMPDDEFRYELDDGVAPRTRLYDRNRKKDVELRSGAYEQAAHVIGDEEYRAVSPFPMTIVPSELVTAQHHVF